MHDVCMMGAGASGLNASLVLGRCGRDVLCGIQGRCGAGQKSRALGFGLTGGGVVAVSHAGQGAQVQTGVRGRDIPCAEPWRLGTVNRTLL